MILTLRARYLCRKNLPVRLILLPSIKSDIPSQKGSAAIAAKRPFMKIREAA